jgi:phosphodiesterase/alkaline phosphatase D-like protein
MLHLSLNGSSTVKVYYATTSPVSASSSTSALVVGSDVFGATHSIQFTRLSQDTVYYYVIETRDAAGNTKVSLEQHFMSDAPPDQPPPGTGTNTTTGSVVGTPTTPLVISSLGVTDVGPSSALIVVSTNQPATTRVHYSDVSPVSLSSGFVTGSSVVGNNATIVLTGLAANTTYYYVIESTDAFGRGVLSGEQSFRTTAVPPQTPPPATPPPPTTPPTTPPSGIPPATTIIPTGGPDVTPPVVSQVSVTQINTMNAVVRATTDELAMVRVFYSPVSPVPMATAQWANLDTFAILHTVNLVGLRPATTYYYVIEAKDALGNIMTTGQGFFTTAANTTSFITANAVPGTTGGPVAGPVHTGSTGSSAISTMQVTALGPTSAIVHSSTPRPSITKIYYSSNPNSLRFARDVATNNIVGTTNSIMLTNLAPNTTYYFVVDVQDVTGASGASSQKSFTTLPAGSPTPPGTGTGTTTVNPGINTGPNEIVGAFVGGLDRDYAIITWPTNHPATSKVYYGFTTPLVLSTATARENTSLVTNHVIDLPSLTPNTLYYYVVESKDAAGNITRSATLSFTTMPNPPSVVSGVMVTSVTSTSAVINVSASGPVTTTKVFYSSNPSLLSLTGPSVMNNVAGTNSTIQLTNLTPNTTYYYTVEVRDAVGASSASSMRFFRTAP